MKVVFTGAATDIYGGQLKRADLIAACQIAGIDVMPRIEKGVDMLVASRHDTIKAKRAKALGIPVCSYEEFLTEHKIPVVHGDGEVNPFTDVNPQEMIPDFTADLPYGFKL